MLKDMKTQTHLNPGQKGTKRLVEKYGGALICVRYRYDEKRGVRMKTVELVIEEKAWKPSVRHQAEDIVSVIAAFSENAIRDRLKAAGGKWDPVKKIWHVIFGSIRGDIELENRILRD